MPAEGAAEFLKALLGGYVEGVMGLDMQGT